MKEIMVFFYKQKKTKNFIASNVTEVNYVVCEVKESGITIIV